MTREPSPPALSPAASAALGAYFWLAAATAVGNDLLLLIGLPCALWALALAVRSALALGRGDGAPRGFGWQHAGLAALATLGAAAPVASPTPLWYEAFARAVPAASLIAIPIFAAADQRGRRRVLLAVSLAVVALALVTPIALPSPSIDLWGQNQTCARALLHGVHPYTVALPDVYRGGYDYGYHTNVLPYTPLVVLANAPGVLLFGDYRFACALCIPGSLLLVRAGARRLGVAAAVIDLATFALVLHPRLAFLVAYGWSEPMMLLALAGFFYFQARSPGGAAQAVCFLLLPALKQYVAAPVILWLDLKPRPRAIAVGLAFAAATALPLLFWNPRATLDGLLFQMRHVTFREDSLSVTALVAAVFGWRAPQWSGIVAQLGGAAIGWTLTRGRGAAGVLVASGLSLLASFLFGSQAFGNYYFFVGGLFLCAALAAPAPAAAEPVGVRFVPALARTIGVAAGITALGLAAATVRFVALCPHARAFQAIERGRAETIPERGFAIARADEQILDCSSRHTFGPFSHQDRACLCAPRAASPAEVERLLGAPAACAVDHPTPSRGDETGRCRHGRCEHHVELPR